MAPTCRLDIWADKTPCSTVNVDCLLPTGILVPIQVRIEATLGEIKSKLWREASSFPLFNLLKDMTCYVFMCVNLQGKTEELIDENRQLIDAKPFRPILKLIERIGDDDEKLHSSKIGILLGKNLHEFEQMENVEVDEFRRRYREFVEGISRERSGLDWESRAIYAYPPDIDNDPIAPPFVERNLMDNRRFLVNVAIRNNKASIKDMHAFNVSADTFPDELLTLVLKKRGAIMNVHDFDNPKDYVLKVVGRECYLLGNYPLLQYQYIRGCIAKSERPELSLVQRASLKVELNVTGKSLLSPGSRPPPPVPGKQSGLSLWSINAMFKVKIASALNVNIAETMRVTVHAGIYHGNEALGSIVTTKEKNGPSPVWNEFLEFDLPVANIPRMARLCLVLYGVPVKRKRRDKESIALAWVNTTLFDFQGHLRQGLIKLTTWQVTETLADQLNPIGTVVSNINTSISPTLFIEFTSYADKVAYPPYDMIVQLAAENTGAEIFKKVNDSDLERLKQIIEKEPLVPIYELDKEFVWFLRIECRENFPHALGKLLSCVKWNCKEDIAQMQVLLQIWSPLEPEMSLELLDYNYADQKVREFAVRCIEKMDDADLLQYILQLVQVLKYESYLDCDLAMFLLKRALKNQNIGHILFWLLKSEMHNPEVSVRFGLMLEAYLRGAPEHMKKLQKQVEALNKLKTITSLLYNVDKDKKEKGIQIMQRCLQQKTYDDALSKLSSPLDPSFKLKCLNVEKCKFMDSKMKPLWLDFHNYDELGKPVKIIFKSGDDLRQDMLTLQLIRIMDRLWKHNGLDLDMIPYGCLSTGNHVGLIQVVENAETLAKIQRREGAIAGAFGKTCILDWLQECNPKDQMEDVTRRFTLSCAGYCVATYVLGIGDRHSDNIMVTKTGQLFHIDFGHFLGNFKSKFGIRRERVPVVLTDHFVHVITNGRTDKRAEDTEEFQQFKQICEQAFLVLRRKGSLLINLFVMMLSAGIPELRTVADIGYLRKALHLDCSEERAIEIFNKKLKEAWVNGWKTSLNWAIHNQVHKD